MAMKIRKPTKEDIMKTLDVCYDKCLNGIPVVSPNVEELANEYLEKYSNKWLATKELVNNQVLKCTTSGVLTGFGGAVTLPVTIPANVGSVLYVQMRMIAAIAYLNGYELDSDATQTFVYACLAGVAVNELLKRVGVTVGTKVATNLIKKIPGKVLTAINKKVGFRLLTKFGSTGVVNFGKLVPGVGAIVGGTFDYTETKIIADRAVKWFAKGNFEPDKYIKQPDEIDEDEIDETEE